jgi:hypothetical protein
MADFLFYTSEGFTQVRNGIDIENCQMLGIAKGKDKVEAQDNLLKDNPWIEEAGFNRSEFIVEQLLPDEERLAIKEVLDYLWGDEEKHFEESGKPDNHIFRILTHLKASI